MEANRFSLFKLRDLQISAFTLESSDFCFVLCYRSNQLLNHNSFPNAFPAFENVQFLNKGVDIIFCQINQLLK